MLELRSLSCHFGPVRAVDGISLAVPAGQMVGVIGRSGAGKSTLLRLINRLVEPTAGEIRFRGVAVNGLRGRALRQWRRRAAMIFQQFNLVPRLDVLTNVLIGRIGSHGVASTMIPWFSAAERAMALAALDRLGMTEQCLQRADTLSGGQQQRVAIARALMQEPHIVLADEPIASLDPVNAATVMDALAAINRDDGITVLCNLHSLATAREYCHRIVGLAQGRVVFDDVPSGLTAAAVTEIYGAAGAAEADDEPPAAAAKPPPPIVGSRLAPQVA
jgi:phosphonate transport system ATP-binding protein